MLPCQILSAPSPQRNDLSSSVSFSGWRLANMKFKRWARKMSALHEPIWRKAGIFEAVNASTYKIHKNTDLVLGVAEKWSPDTKTFVFSWGEATITLEDVMVLSGFSVLGSPAFATLDSSGKKIMERLKNAWQTIKREGKVNLVTQVAWMDRFMNCGGELEHVAFLVLWLGYFVLPSRFDHLCETIFPIAVNLSSGTRIALAPAVLAHLYADLSLLKTHISKSPPRVEIRLSALFMLVQVWTWERFRELQPKPNSLLAGKPRVAIWKKLKQQTSNVRQILDNSKIDSFEWRPYTRSVTNWKFPQFYPEKAMCVHVSPSLDEELISFARCIKDSELVGIEKVEHYFPNRVASQFGMLQDVPSPHVDRNNLSREAAWNDYNKPIDDLALHIPSRSAIPRVTSTFCEWWRKTYPELIKYSSKEKDADESVETLNIISDDTISGSSNDEMTIAEYSNKRLKCIEEARDKRRKYMEQARERGSKRTSNDEMKIAEDSNKRRKYMMQDRKKDESTTGVCSISVQPSEIEKRNEMTDGSGSKAGKSMAVSLFDENNSSDPPLGANDSYEKRLQKLKVLASSLEERMNKTQKTVALLVERKSIKERKPAAARLI